MKISIQQEDVTSSVKFEDFDIFEFTTHLRNLLYSVWYPEQVNEIMPTEESLSDEFERVRKEAYDEGYEEGEAANAKSAETIFEEGRAKGFEEGRAKGFEEGLDRGYEESLDKGFDEGYCKGYENGEASNAKSAELIYDEGRQEGYVTAVAEMRATYEPLLKAAAKDSERLDWLMENHCLRDWISQENVYGLNEGREYIDEAMEESAANAKSAETTEHLQDCIREGKDNAEKSNILCKQDSSNIL